jgi:hypothetical protein
MSAEMGCMGSPTIARVPALATTKPPGTAWFRPACSSLSATGERQMLPVQTVRIRTGADVSKGIFSFQPVCGPSGPHVST